jgi:hypothetical protein
MAGSKTFLKDISRNAKANGLTEAIANHQTEKLFNAILPAFSYQGISDAVARQYMKRNGSATWRQIRRNLSTNPSCPRLKSYWHYHECRYDKGHGSCSELSHLARCPVPTHRLRNGRLNQTAYSFFLFVRDVLKQDLVGWIDQQLATLTSCPSESMADGRLQEILIGPLRHVYGVSDKILTMTLSELLLSAPHTRPRWHRAGESMIAVDTLVHNFLHRTGISSTCGVEHAYGVKCYRPAGCADIIRRLSHRIDARQFEATFPEAFPRFVQHSLWRYCASEGLNVCNGNQIDDRQPCQTRHCIAFAKCARKPLKPSKIQ